MENAFKAYCEQIASLPVLGEKETECFERLRHGDESMRRIIIEGNLKLVLKIANEFPRINDTYKEDIVQAGNRGLMDAVEHFDHKRGTKFSTFARYYILHEIRRELVVLHGAGIINPGVANIVAMKIKKYKTEVNPHPTIKELCDELGLQKRIVQALYNGWHFMSMQEKNDEDGKERIESFCSFEKTPSEIVCEESIQEEILSLCREILSDSERDMLFRFYGFGTEKKKLWEIATLYPPHTASRIQQIIQNSIRKIRLAASGIR